MKSIDYSCNPNYDVAQIGVVTRWTPVKNLTLSGEVMFFQEFKDQNTLALNLRRSAQLLILIV